MVTNLIKTTLQQAFAWVWVGAGWLLLLPSSYFDYHLQCLLESLVVSRALATAGDETRSLLWDFGCADFNLLRPTLPPLPATAAAALQGRRKIETTPHIGQCTR